MGTQTTNEEGRFIRHSPCPKCGSRDNLAEYSDGHSYCFGCHYFIPASLEFTTRRLVDSSISRMANPPSFPAESTPYCSLGQGNKAIAGAFLKKYGLTNQEIEDLRVLWSESLKQLIFPQYEDNQLIGYIARNFSGKGSKYIIKGEKKKFTKIYGSGTILVMTEDLISSVKVGRVAAALPLFGTNCSSFPSDYDEYRLWLDKDKQISSVEQCRKWRQYGYIIRPIITDKDPKEYSTEDIRRIVMCDTDYQ